MRRKIVKKVFVVDDSIFDASILQDYITEHTMHKVEVFSTGEECLRRLGDEPDVIILDYNLNSVNADAANGDKILSKMKRLAPFIYVIILSGQDEYGVAIQTVMHGADSYVIKGKEAFKQVVKLIDRID